MVQPRKPAPPSSRQTPEGYAAYLNSLAAQNQVLAASVAERTARVEAARARSQTAPDNSEVLAAQADAAVDATVAAKDDEAAKTPPSHKANALPYLLAAIGNGKSIGSRELCRHVRINPNSHSIFERITKDAEPGSPDERFDRLYQPMLAKMRTDQEDRKKNPIPEPSTEPLTDIRIEEVGKRTYDDELHADQIPGTDLGTETGTEQPKGDRT